MTHEYKLEIKEENDHSDDIANFILQGMDYVPFHKYFMKREPKIEYKADIKLVWNFYPPPTKIRFPEHVHIERDDGFILSLEYVLEYQLENDETYIINNRNSFVVRTNAKSEEVVQELLTELFQKSAQIDTK